ncbi:hypothetical protein JF634_00875 [Simonsiella muelleri]|uniref:Uncharacterized protein n=1 Tax=Simonsiella muelleri ATCC 29453 TaxID=641147 RepID=V9HDF8_9NEIS|nr:hypothetical protein [Simonsiella muelleri]AUX62001.1 hypothetical protein BWP33_09475 [Simonsiella muelleri ATCC 29453]EFG31491.1 hypothetical protein HMPREF9021_00761 [Simonsiella muelleri ATCC 29453]UBQ54100.1 hypothetical protein JF634_00875 [Simonsiella muelleri]
MARDWLKLDDSTRDWIIDYLRENPLSNTEQVRAGFGYSWAAMRDYLDHMVELGLLEKRDNGVSALFLVRY